MARSQEEIKALANQFYEEAFAVDDPTFVEIAEIASRIFNLPPDPKSERTVQVLRVLGARFPEFTGVELGRTARQSARALEDYANRVRKKTDATQ